MKSCFRGRNALVVARTDAHHNYPIKLPLTMNQTLLPDFFGRTFGFFGSFPAGERQPKSIGGRGIHRRCINRNREYVCPLTLTIAENTPEMMCIRDFDTPVLARGQEMELHLIPAFHSLSFLYSSFLPSFLRVRMNYETIEMTDLASRRSTQNKGTFYSDSTYTVHAGQHTTKNKLSPPASFQTFPARNHQLLCRDLRKYAFNGDSRSSVHPMSCQPQDIGYTEDQLSNLFLFPTLLFYGELAEATGETL